MLGFQSIWIKKLERKQMPQHHLPLMVCYYYWVFLGYQSLLHLNSAAVHVGVLKQNLKKASRTILQDNKKACYLLVQTKIVLSISFKKFNEFLIFHNNCENNAKSKQVSSNIAYHYFFAFCTNLMPENTQIYNYNFTQTRKRSKLQPIDAQP